VVKIRELCGKLRIDVQVNDKLIERLAPNENSYAVGIFRKYERELRADRSHVVLVNPSDMGNMGTIMRTMLGFGVEDLAIVRPGVDVFDPRVIRASMGALFQLSFAYFDSFEAYSGAFPRAYFPFMTDGEVSLLDARFTSPYSLIFGNEGAGLPDTFRHLGKSVTIAHTNRIDSLNLPVAVGIALYEATQEKF
jgi:TrmH family RNA methyltransferase